MNCSWKKVSSMKWWMYDINSCLLYMAGKNETDGFLTWYVSSIIFECVYKAGTSFISYYPSKSSPKGLIERFSWAITEKAKTNFLPNRIRALALSLSSASLSTLLLQNRESWKLDEKREPTHCVWKSKKMSHFHTFNLSTFMPKLRFDFYGIMRLFGRIFKLCGKLCYMANFSHRQTKLKTKIPSSFPSPFLEEISAFPWGLQMIPSGDFFSFFWPVAFAAHSSGYWNLRKGACRLGVVV